MIEALMLATFVLAAATVPMVALLVVRRMQLARRERLRERLEERVVPLALALVDGETDGSEWTIDRQEGEAIARVLTRYSRLLSGEARARIAGFFEARGLVRASCLDAVRARRAWRRAMAAHMLGDMASPSAIDSLLSCLEDPDRSVSSTAALSLGRLKAERAVEPLISALVAERIPSLVAGQALLEIGPVALGALEPLLGAEQARVRITALELITQLGDAASAAPVMRCLKDPSPGVREQACTALGRLGAGQAALELRGALSDPEASVRAAAAAALGAIGDRQAVEPLIRHARSDAFAPGRSAARAVARIEPKRIRELAGQKDAGPHLSESADRLAAGLL